MGFDLPLSLLGRSIKTKCERCDAVYHDLGSLKPHTPCVTWVTANKESRFGNTIHIILFQYRFKVNFGEA